MLGKCALLLILASYSAGTPLQPKALPEDYVLPEGAVEVLNYNIYLDVSKDLFVHYNYTGIVTIRFRNLKDTNVIKLHASEMTFQSTTLVREETAGDVTLGVTNTGLIDPDTDILTLELSAQLAIDAVYKLTFEYTGKLRTEEMAGFYLSSYTNGATTVPLGTTQFQPTSARKAFPCFDEPIYKATFDLSMKHLSIYTPFGNTPSDTVVDTADATVSTTTFEQTPKMSTYLLAFVVSDFTCTDSALPNPYNHRVCSRNSEEPHRAKAAEYGPQLITVMESFTGIDYLDSGIGKMDQVAIPDFSAGAMENWGLLTYRETGVLWNEQQSSNSYLQGLGNVLAHEIVHMWFGNLVTTHSWADTFLNEGFARLLQYYAFGQVENTWELDKQFVTAVLQPMLALDAQPAAAALSEPAYTQSQISGRFASVSYNKGGSLLRMIRDCIMGATNFEQGIKTYLGTHSLGSTTPENLWTALQGFVPQGNLPNANTLSQVMYNWVNNPGFPVLHVSENGTTVTISQTRFVVSGTANTNDKWTIPITYTRSSDQNKFENMGVQGWVLSNTDLVIENALAQDTDWILLNNQQIGFYRIQYSETLFTKIEAAIKSADFGGITDLNRAQLVDDVYNLARVGTYDYRTVFEFFQFLANDTSYYSWNAAFRAFSTMLQTTGNEQIRTSLSAYILELMVQLYQSVPFDVARDNDQIYTFNRVQAVTWACRLGHEECINKSRTAFSNYRTANTMPDKNLKTTVYCNGLRHSTDAQGDWDFLWGKYESTALATEEATILSALGCSTDRDVLIGFLNKSIDKTSGIRQQDAFSVFSTVYTSNPIGVDIAFEFLRNNYVAISDYYGSMNAIINLFNGLTDRFTSQDQITLLEEFLTNEADNLSETVNTAGAAALENARANLVLLELFESQLKTYFNIDDDTGTADSLQVGLATSAISLMVILYQMWN